MIGILSKSSRSTERPPDPPFAMNMDSWQSQGLVAWYPFVDPADFNTHNNLPDIWQLTNNGSTIVTDPTLGRKRNFVRASSQSIGRSGAILTAAPLTMSCWASSTDTVNFQTAMAMGQTAGSNNAFMLRFEGNVAGDPIRLYAGNGSFSTASTTTGYTSGKLHHLCGVCYAATKRSVFIDGGSKGTDATSKVPGIDNFDCGVAHINAVASGYLNGTLGDARLYNWAIPDDLVWELYDPATRWDLYYPIGRKAWSFPFHTGGGGGGLSIPIAMYHRLRGMGV